MTKDKRKIHMKILMHERNGNYHARELRDAICNDCKVLTVVPHAGTAQCIECFDKEWNYAFIIRNKDNFMKDINQRIVCAANKHKENNYIILGIRHWDNLMKGYLNMINISSLEAISHQNFEQGFIDNRGNFLTREEAFIVAKAANQIIKKTGGEDSQQLFSEDLY